MRLDYFSVFCHVDDTLIILDVDSEIEVKIQFKLLVSLLLLKLKCLGL